MIKKIAFIGLGNMGSGMAKNLVKNGFSVLAFDLSSDAMAMAKENGCELAESAKQAVECCDAVVTMLPAGKHVKGIYEETVLPNAKSGTRNTKSHYSLLFDNASVKKIADICSWEIEKFGYEFDDKRE